MNDILNCDRDCALAGVCRQPQTCPTPPALVALPEVRERFDREAVRGVCDTGRYRCSYFSWGSGPPLLFVPGLSDTAGAFMLPMSRLVGQFRCLGMELPHGGGDGARLSQYRHEHLADDVFALLDHLGLERCYLFGSSMGSTVVLRALHDRPERIPRAILQGGFARRPLTWYEWLLSVASRPWPGLMRHVPLRERVLAHVHRGHFDGRPPESWRFYIDGSGSFPIATTAHQALLLNGIDLRPLLPHIGQPVLLISGESDRVVPAQCQEELLAGLPHARLAELQGSGHVPYHTHPEALAELVRSFLTPPVRDGNATCSTNGSDTRTYREAVE